MNDLQSVSHLFFLDTNVILQCRPLSELPWGELVTEGTILALVSRTAMKEIDGKKRDGRLGKIARHFNKLVAPLAIGGGPLVIRERAPRVLLALSQSNNIDWDMHHDLDPDEPDHRIAAEAIYAKGLPELPRTLISHDIQPLLAATGAGLKAYRISDEWLRPIEPSPKDKQIQRLKNEVSIYKKTEPAFDIKIDLNESFAPKLVKMVGLSDFERDDLKRQIIRTNPKKSQERQSRYFIGLDDYDSSYSDRYEEWQNKRLPAFMEVYERQVAIAQNQVWFSIEVENIGEVQADSIKVDISVNHGWMNRKPVWISPQGPPPPSPRSRHSSIHNLHNMNNLAENTPRHNFAFSPNPSRCQSFAALCEDFRHGHNWRFEGVLGLDVWEISPTVISVAITAANFHGTARAKKSIDWTVEEYSFDDLAEGDKFEFKRATIIQPIIESRNYKDIDMGHDDEDY